MQKTITLLITTFSLLTAVGVFIHDGRIDRAVSTPRVYGHGKATETKVSELGLTGNPHIHPEKVGRTLKGFTYQSPTVPPRENRSKRYMLQNAEPRGRHAFDSHYLPLVS